MKPGSRQYVELAEPLLTAVSDIFNPAWFREFSRPVWRKPRAVEFPAFAPSTQPIVPIDVSWMPAFPALVKITYAAVPCGESLGRGE